MRSRLRSRLFLAMLVAAAAASQEVAQHKSPDVVATSAAAVQQPTPSKPTTNAAVKPVTKRTKKKPSQPKQDWQLWSDSLTGDLLSDDWRLSRLDRAVFQARLCSMWWESNSVRAKQWCEEAVEAVTYTSWNEQENARNERLEAARAVLRLVSSLDDTLRDKVEDTIKLAVTDNEDPRRGQRGQLAATLARAALDQPDNPVLMAQLIADSLRQGGHPLTAQAIVKLREKDPARADELFTEAAAIVARTQDPLFVALFVSAAFPRVADTPPDGWRFTALQALSQNLSIPARSGTERDERCSPLRQYLTSINDKYPAGIPAATLGMLDYCVPAQTARELPSEEMKTSEDLLRAAKRHPDPAIRQELKLSAAIRADRTEDNPARGVEILESITPEEMNSRPGIIRLPWIDMASRAVMVALAKNETEEARTILDRTPDPWRPETEILILEKGVPQGLRGIPEIITRCRTDLNRYPVEDPLNYIRFLNLALKYHWPARPQILRETLRNLDDWEPKDPNTLQVNELYYMPLEGHVAPLPIVPDILELELETLRAMASVIDKVTLRKSYQFAVLRPAISRSREATRLAKKETQ